MEFNKLTRTQCSRIGFNGSRSATVSTPVFHKIQSVDAQGKDTWRFENGKACLYRVNLKCVWKLENQWDILALKRSRM